MYHNRELRTICFMSPKRKYMMPVFEPSRDHKTVHTSHDIQVLSDFDDAPAERHFYTGRGVRLQKYAHNDVSSFVWRRFFGLKVANSFTCVVRSRRVIFYSQSSPTPTKNRLSFCTCFPVKRSASMFWLVFRGPLCHVGTILDSHGR